MAHMSGQHFKELADRGGKRALQRAGFDVRMP